MIFKYIGDFSIDVSRAGLQSEGYGNERQWGNMIGDSPATLGSFLLLPGREWESTCAVLIRFSFPGQRKDDAVSYCTASSEQALFI